MTIELGAMRHEIEVSRRIIANGPGDGDPIVHSMVRRELERRVAELERRVEDAPTMHADRRAGGDRRT